MSRTEPPTDRTSTSTGRLSYSERKLLIELVANTRALATAARLFTVLVVSALVLLLVALVVAFGLFAGWWHFAY